MEFLPLIEPGTGTLVYILEGIDPEGDPLNYGVESDSFAVPEPATGKVFLTRKLDHEVRD